MTDKTIKQAEERDKVINKVLYETYGNIRKILLEELDRKKADDIYNRIVLQA